MKLSRALTTIDTHTAGGPTRTITAGLPPLAGASVAEKMEDFRTRFDPVRKLLMTEPRGHRDMSGAVITEPSHPDADLGVFFLTASGYLPACVHSTIGVTVAGLETGFLRPAAQRPDGAIVLETPSGLVSAIPLMRNGSVESVALRTAAAFVHTPAARLELASVGSVEVALAFCGVFFLLVDAGQLGLPAGASGTVLAPANAGRFTALGVNALEAASRTFQVEHPENPRANSIALAMFYQEVGDRHGRDIVVGGSGGVDRSPCGAGTGAKVAFLFSQGRLAAGEDYVNESFLGTRFVGRALRAARVGPYAGAMPEIEGQAFITGMHQFFLDVRDPLPEGFLF
jgi:proline racemase